MEPKDVVSEGSAGPGIAASDAYAVAEISYRQLDHWARQGWVRQRHDFKEVGVTFQLFGGGDGLDADVFEELPADPASQSRASRAGKEFDEEAFELVEIAGRGVPDYGLKQMQKSKWAVLLTIGS